VTIPRAWALARQRGHVVPAPGPVVDLRQHQHPDLFGHRPCHGLGFNDPQLEVAPEPRHEALRHVEIGGEVPAVGQDHLPLGQRHRGRQRLEQPDRQGVAHGDGSLPRPDKRPDPVPEPIGQSHPVGPVPSADRHDTPFVLETPARRRSRAHRKGTQRIAIEIDLPRRQDEPRARRLEIRHDSPSRGATRPPSSFRKYALPEQGRPQAGRCRKPGRHRHARVAVTPPVPRRSGSIARSRSAPHPSRARAPSRSPPPFPGAACAGCPGPGRLAPRRR
jgi:hypothetical protein